MSAMQKHFVRTCGKIIGVIIIVMVSIAGLVYEWQWVLWAWLLACCLFFIYAAMMAIGELVYKWRVWGVVNNGEGPMYYRWKFHIFDGSIDCALSQLELRELDDEFEDEETYRKHYNFLLKIKEVPIPKILQVGA